MFLACQLAEQLRAQHEQALNSIERPGGMNYLLPPNVSVEVYQQHPFLRDCRRQ